MKQLLNQSMIDVEKWDVPVHTIFVSVKDEKALPEIFGDQFEKNPPLSRPEYMGCLIGTLWGANVVASGLLKKGEVDIITSPGNNSSLRARIGSSHEQATHSLELRLGKLENTSFWGKFFGNLKKRFSFRPGRPT